MAGRQCQSMYANILKFPYNEPIHSFSSVRRGSVWGGGNALGAPSTSQIMKDTRPLREKPYQAQMRDDVYRYLRDSGFEISQQTLASMQGKDYRAIFDTLVLTLDPCHPLREGARFEDEFIPALRALKYPFVNQLDSKWLAAVASPHSWPYLLGVLHWLVELCKVFLLQFNSVNSHPHERRCAVNIYRVDTPLFKILHMYQNGLTTHTTTKHLHFSIMKKHTFYG